MCKSKPLSPHGIVNGYTHWKLYLGLVAIFAVKLVLRRKYPNRIPVASNSRARRPWRLPEDNPPPPISVAEADPPPMYQSPGHRRASIRANLQGPVDGSTQQNEAANQGRVGFMMDTRNDTGSSNAARPLQAASICSSEQSSSVPLQVPPQAHLSPESLVNSPSSPTPPLALLPSLSRTPSSPPPDFDTIVFYSPTSVPMPPATSSSISNTLQSPTTSQA